MAPLKQPDDQSTTDPVPLTVGSALWIFDENRRVYPESPGGRRDLSARPIWREHWRPVAITGATSRSWLIGGRPPRKISKAELAAGTVHGVLTSEEALDAACYVHDHAFEVGRRVQALSGRLAAADVLRQIAALVGYTP